ncbi:TPA: hypothetical protein HA244_03580 [Candidatus Micrarchaeota archaeon]|nr:hypothetical protein [Candidatus Micrarchaeota archaeon]
MAKRTFEDLDAAGIVRKMHVELSSHHPWLVVSNSGVEVRRTELYELSRAIGVPAGQIKSVLRTLGTRRLVARAIQKPRGKKTVPAAIHLSDGVKHAMYFEQDKHGGQQFVLHHVVDKVS